MKEAQLHNSLYSTDLSADLAHFDRLYYQYHQAVYANIYKLVSDAQNAEDILQEVFLSLWENRQQLDLEKVAGWLFVVSYNKAATYLKRKLKESTVFVAENSSTEHVVAPEAPDEQLYQLRLLIVEEAIDRLPARKKEVFRLCRFEGKSHDEVAVQLGISVLSVKDYLKQSTQFIRQYVHNRYPHFEISSLSLLLIYFS
ncbi:sigma-70 family RNA polymerase sigma factor [Paraflavitalea speifideaquila]|uniref:sigma-70 family RNA polymerase sigma factor n=1 Tax=Paraflavitalea speifideaquila TaxID=3076558 RepID=UPI0028E6432E|nr:sigma-70 family RNA polymerase sigma factor [Paraflavitalea speifideiaquila]